MQVAARCLIDCLSDNVNSIGVWLAWTFFYVPATCAIKHVDNETDKQVAARCLVDCLSDSANSIGLWLVWTNKTFQPPGFLSATVYKIVSHVMFTLIQYTVIIPITFVISVFWVWSPRSVYE